MTDFTFRSACLFGGGGGMGLGTKQAHQRFREHAGRFELAGAYDFDAYACKVYEYLTGSHEAQLDARSATPGDIWRLLGGVSPHACWLSAPCKGSSKLLSSAKAATEKYVAMNDLSYRGVLTLLDAFPGDEPAFLIFENVPNITTRAKRMLTDLRSLLRERGYLIHDGFHEARHLGDLAQRRKRWFMVARNPRKVPVFLYKPPHKPGKVCGDVLGPLPLPNDPAGGPMHRLSDTSTINLLRLWAIPAGGDWRDLIQDGRPRRERFRRHHIEKWTEPSVTIGGSGSNGPCAVADPRPEAGVELGRARPGFTSMDHVLGWEDPSRTITGATRPGNGAPSVADPRPLNLAPEGAPWFNGAVGVEDWTQATRTVIGGRYNGAVNVAAPIPPELRPQAGNADMHWGKYVVVQWGGSSPTVTGASRVGSGAQSVADPRVPLGTVGSSFHEGSGPGRWGVLSPIDTSCTVTGNARVNTGPFSYAAPAPAPVDLVPREKCYDAGYGVLDKGQPSRTIAANAAVGCGAYAIADDVPPVRLELGCTPHAGAYGVTPFDRESATVVAHGQIDNSRAAVADPRPVAPPYVVLSCEETRRIVDGEVSVPFAIIDPAHPGEPLAIVDDLKRPPFRWVETRGPRGKVTRKRETVALVLISEDGTWHRPLTTLELAVLQGFPWQHRGAPLDFGGGTTSAREVIGNAVPPPVARAMAEQMLLSLIVSATVGFTLGDPGTPVWVKNVRRLERELRREGYVVVKGRRPMNFTTGEFLDDGAARWATATAKKRPPRKAASTTQAVPNMAFVHHHAAMQ